MRRRCLGSWGLTFLPKSAANTEVKLDRVEKCAKPRKLGDLAPREALEKLKRDLLAGKGGDRPLSPNSVNSILRTVRAALNWAHKERGWLEHPVYVKLIPVKKDDLAKARPITDDEFELLRKACDKVRPNDSKAWQFLLTAMWETGMRATELVMCSWGQQPGAPQPVILPDNTVVIRFPAESHKQGRTVEIGVTPRLATMLVSIPEHRRRGRVFAPLNRNGRPYTPITVGKHLSAIGREANVIVNEDGKVASAHDIRRGFATRMANAGIPIRDLQSLMRHKSIQTTEDYYIRNDAVKQTERLAKYLGTAVPKDNHLSAS